MQENIPNKQHSGKKSNQFNLYPVIRQQKMSQVRRMSRKKTKSLEPSWIKSFNSNFYDILLRWNSPKKQNQSIPRYPPFRI